MKPDGNRPGTTGYMIGSAGTSVSDLLLRRRPCLACGAGKDELTVVQRRAISGRGLFAAPGLCRAGLLNVRDVGIGAGLYLGRACVVALRLPQPGEERVRALAARKWLVCALGYVQPRHATQHARHNIPHANPPQ
jgi:hypothetical protein